MDINVSLIWCCLGKNEVRSMAVEKYMFTAVQQESDIVIDRFTSNGSREIQIIHKRFRGTNHYLLLIKNP